MTEHHFETHEPVQLVVEIGKGHVDVTATDTTETRVQVEGRTADEVTVEQSGRQISVVGPRRSGLFSGDSALQVTVTVPTGSGLFTRLGSADLVGHGSFGTSKVKCGSGDVRLEVLAEASIVETGSGDVRVDGAHAELRIKSGSGDVSVGQAGAGLVVSTGSGDVVVDRSQGASVVKTGSGDLSIGATAADVTVTTGSGDVQIGSAARGRISAKGASGDIRVGIPSGTPVWTDVSTVSGAIRSDLQGAGQPEEGQDHVELRARTVSGDIQLVQV